MFHDNANQDLSILLTENRTKMQVCPRSTLVVVDDLRGAKRLFDQYPRMGCDILLYDNFVFPLGENESPK